MEIDRGIDWKITRKRRCYASRSNPWGAVWGGVNPPVGEIWKRGTYQILFSKSLQPRGPAGFFSIGKHRQSQKHTHTNTRTRAHAHACGHAHAHAHAHAHTDTHARAHALEHAQAPRPPPSCFLVSNFRLVLLFDLLLLLWCWPPSVTMKSTSPWPWVDWLRSTKLGGRGGPRALAPQTPLRQRNKVGGAGKGRRAAC